MPEEGGDPQQHLTVSLEKKTNLADEKTARSFSQFSCCTRSEKKRVNGPIMRTDSVGGVAAWPTIQQGSAARPDNHKVLSDFIKRSVLASYSSSGESFLSSFVTRLRI